MPIFIGRGAPLPISTSFDLDIIRTELAVANRFLGTFAEDAVIELGPFGASYGEPLYFYAEKCKAIREGRDPYYKSAL